MKSFIPPVGVILATLVALEVASATPVSQSAGYGDTGTNVGIIMSEYTGKVQSLRETVAILRQILFQKLSTARISNVEPGCFTYPYQPSKPDPSRLTDDIETLRKLLPIATSAAQFEAALNVSNSSVEALLVDEAVTKLEDVVSDFSEVGKALPPVDNTAAEEEGAEGKTVASPASGASCALVRSVLQEYEVVLELYIALTYTVNDAVILSNYYNSPA